MPPRVKTLLLLFQQSNYRWLEYGPRFPTHIQHGSSLDQLREASLRKMWRTEVEGELYVFLYVIFMHIVGGGRYLWEFPPGGVSNIWIRKIRCLKFLMKK